MVATIKTYQRQEVERAVNPVPVRAPQTSLGALGEGIDAVGDTLENWQDEIDTADAKAADSEYSDLIRQELYADETGFMYSQGGDSVNQRSSVSERLEAEQKRILDDLSPRARQRAQSAMDARYQRGLQTVDQHTAGQRGVYLDTASEARIVSSVQDAIFNPDMVAQSIATTDQEIIDLGERNGWAPEVTALKRQEARTKIHSGIIARLESVSPPRALEYLRDNRNQMSGSEVARLEGLLVPRVREYNGRAAGAAAATGLPSYTHSTQIDYSMGPSRPNRPAKPVLDVVGKTVENVLGAGARVVVTSGTENQGDQHGSNRHKTGHAADIQIFRPDGSIVKAGDPEAALIAREAASLGALGIGFGDDYMGGDSFHIDLVKPGAGQANTWGSQGTAMRSEITGLMQTRADGAAAGLGGLLEIEDPQERKAALDEYNLRMGIESKRAEAARQGAEDAAFQMIEAGGNVNDLPTEYRQNIGIKAMNSLRAYQERLAKGRPAQTDDEFFVELTEAMAQSPDQFMSSDPMEWRDKLDDADFAYFTKLRSDMIAGKRADPTLSTMKAQANAAVDALGGGERDAKLTGRVVRHLMEWSKANPDLAADEFALYKEAARAVATVEIDYVFGNVKKRAVDIDFGGKTFTKDDDIGSVEFRTQLLEGDVYIQGQHVPASVAKGVFSDVVKALGREPTPDELLQALIAKVL